MKYFLIIIFSLCYCSFVSAQNANNYTPVAKKFFESMEQGRYHEAYLMLDTSVTRIVTEQENSEGWKSIMAKLGKLKKQTRSRVEEIKPYTDVFLTCAFDSGTIDIKIVFKETPAIIGYFFVPVQKYSPPPYADTLATTERNIEVRTGNYILSGVLTLPKKGGLFPVVILVHGSGPHDKDETIGYNKPFKDLAYGLAAKGIATLRYDKRTFAYGIKSAPDPKKITLKEETVDDAESALRLAKTFKEIDANKIFLLGHSLGAIAAPRIAKAAPFIAGIIFMAGNARPFEDVILDQMAYILPLQAPKKQADSILQEVTAQVARIRRHDFNDSTATLPLGLSGVYWKDIKNYDQLKTAMSLSTPMLFLQGDKDYQVTMKDFNLWKQSLRLKKNATFISYPGLYHLFMPGEGRPSDYDKTDHISEKVVSDIAEWIKK
ncbi:MAG: alpha/beta fold hydrolase [Candidatus Kapaibacterium sp.]